MSFTTAKILFCIMSIMLYLCVRPSKSVQEISDFRLVADNFQYNYVTISRSRKTGHRKLFKTVAVYDNMACILQCTRMADSCTSVNFKKRATNGLHSCELMTENTYDQPGALVHDEQFDHIALQLPIYSNCAEIYKSNGRTNGVYRISPVPSRPIQVYCDMVTSGGGWTVIQKRIDGSVNFDRNWADYKRGFGNKLGEYWLGLDNMHTMTSQRSYRLRVDLEDFEGNTRYAEYDSFIVADEADNYRLTLGTYSGTSGDSFTYHHGGAFSTKDRDTNSCAITYKGGGWYKACHHSNINGKYYLPGATKPSARGIVTLHWKGFEYSLKRVEMKIRPVRF